MKKTFQLSMGYGKANIRDKGLSWDKCTTPGCEYKFPISLMSNKDGKVICCVCERKHAEANPAK